MLQIREIRLSGARLADASVKFGPGPNVIAGESDTGKSYLLHCLDYIFGADELKKRIPYAEPYEKLTVEFQNSAGEYLCLVTGAKPRAFPVTLSGRGLRCGCARAFYRVLTRSLDQHSRTSWGR